MSKVIFLRQFSLRFGKTLCHLWKLFTLRPITRLIFTPNKHIKLQCHKMYNTDETEQHDRQKNGKSSYLTTSHWHQYRCVIKYLGQHEKHNLTAEKRETWHILHMHLIHNTTLITNLQHSTQLILLLTLMSRNVSSSWWKINGDCRSIDWARFNVPPNTL